MSKENQNLIINAVNVHIGVLASRNEISDLLNQGDGLSNIQAYFRSECEKIDKPQVKAEFERRLEAIDGFSKRQIRVFLASANLGLENTPENQKKLAVASALLIRSDVWSSIDEAIATAQGITLRYSPMLNMPAEKEAKERFGGWPIFETKEAFKKAYPDAYPYPHLGNISEKSVLIK